MFKIKPMRPEDFSFATELANTMDWNMAIEDFQFMTHLEPEGCFVLFDDSTPLGIATSVSYGKVGWFGNLIVKKDNRKKGAGSLLLKHSVDYLHGKGVETIGLYAYPNRVNFYGNLGFKADEEFAVLHAQTLNVSTNQTLPKIGKRNLQAVTEFDRECFGGDRKNLLKSIILEKGNLSYYESSRTEVVGYVAATVYETMAWVGPLICQEGNVDIAVKLLKTVLAKLTGLKIYMALPKKETALVDMLSAVGFKEDFSVVRMYLGPTVAKNCIYLAESLERG